MALVYVLGNDYPDAVFTTAKVAQEYCALKTAERIGRDFGTRIYWRFYDFELLETLPKAVPKL